MRYRFGDFVLSPARRVLAEGGRVVPLIPRYFDLLVLLVEQRDRAVTKQEIFDRVWSDAAVSESALTQAIRTIRRTLADDPREPRFVRTVSRHGYQFVFVPVAVEDDAGPWPVEGEGSAAISPGESDAVDETPAVAPAPPPTWRVALTLAADRWPGAALGAGAAGALAGLAGALALAIVPGSRADARVALTLSVVGALAGAVAGAGVGAGVAAAAAVRSNRTVALTIGGSLMGMVTGWLAHHGARAVLSGVFGRDVAEMGGAIEGLVLGAATGLGLALATSSWPAEAGARPGMHWRAAALTASTCAIAAIGLALTGRHLVGSSLDLMAGVFAGSQVGLEPLARLLGEEQLRPLTRLVVSACEGAMFGLGVALGLTAGPFSAPRRV